MTVANGEVCNNEEFALAKKILFPIAEILNFFGKINSRIWDEFLYEVFSEGISMSSIYGPCPCGSGKKIKFCCYSKSRGEGFDEFAYAENTRLPEADVQRCSDLLHRLDDYVLELGQEVFGQKILVFSSDDELRLQIRDGWQSSPSFIDRFITDHADLSADDVAVLKSWKGRAREEFILFEYGEDYSIFCSTELCVLYGVKSLRSFFVDIVPFKPPYWVVTTLLPYKDHIIWDGLCGVSAMKAKAPALLNLQYEYKRVLRSGKVICSGSELR
jgi:hypothetical protein